MRLSLIQSDILWENAQANLERYQERIASLKGKSDLVVLPEVCANGFGSDACKVAQYNDGMTITQFRQMAIDNQLAIAGSFIAKEDDRSTGTTRFFNRGFFIFPDGTTRFVDKRHLFRIGSEGEQYTAGGFAPFIVSYLGWNIRLIVCYDLRFPVFCRNVDLSYDLMLVVANWPEIRIKSWKNMLEARATENQAIVCGVNRVGTDGLGLYYNGASAVFNAIGTEISHIAEDKEQLETICLDKEQLLRHRRKFPAWMDADRFDYTDLT